MPKALHLFGSNLQKLSRQTTRTFRKYQLTRRIPNPATGRTPSAASQMALYGDDDFNSHFRITPRNQIFNKRISPQTSKRDFDSKLLNTTIRNLRVTPAALYAIDDAGGFDHYILNTSPEELRSNSGEKLRNLMYFYSKNPEIKEWGLPWKVLMRKRDQMDPWYARLQHELRKRSSERRLEKAHAPFSPYYLPRTEVDMFPKRQRPTGTSTAQVGSIERWWSESSELEVAFRKRLTMAKSFEERHTDHREPDAYTKGRKRGGGGPQATSMRKSSKTHKARRIRPY